MVENENKKHNCSGDCNNCEENCVGHNNCSGDCNNCGEHCSGHKQNFLAKLNEFSHIKKIIGVEIIPEAIEDAKVNAKNNKIENCEFYCGDAKDAVKILKDQNILTLFF